MPTNCSIFALAGLALAASSAPAQTTAPAEGRREYVASRTGTPPAIDGRLDDPAWRSDLEEPDLWGTITARDAVIFQNNDFEVFLDPDGDQRNYFELEINALGTMWDLFLARTYRDGGQADNRWDIVGLRSAVALRGTINDASDRDAGWSLELALPWRSLAPPGLAGRAPRVGDSWRVNFSRVEWNLVAAAGGYTKRTDPAGGKPLAEMNWVWSPQGVIDMHRPERWGVVRFIDGGNRETVR